MNETAAWLPLIFRAVVVGVLGGVGLILAQVFSRRGPLIFPVYAAILASLGFVSARYEGMTYTGRFTAVLAGMLVSTTFALVAVLVMGGRQRRELVAAGYTLGPGGAPWWGFPLIGIAIALSSAAVAYVSS